MTARRLDVLPGSAFPLGASVDADGVNFAVFSESGTRAFVCLFDPADPTREIARHELWERTAHVFHGYLPRVRPGAMYGFRVEGPYRPEEGHRFNASKLLVDPYARALHGEVDWKAPMFGYAVDGPAEDRDLVSDPRDDAPGVPKAIVVHQGFDWGGDRPPGVPWGDTILYELHVRGFTMRHPDIPEPLRGTYLGLAHPAAIAHLKRLGVTTIELMPVQQFVVDGFLLDRGLTNYWGYSTLGYFAPEQSYASSNAPGEQVREFKQMVKALHAAGLGVILDVVYNHTCEGNHLGPTLSFRGLDNAAYYHLSPENRRYYRDETGCGNTFNLGSLYTTRLVIDSLRYWVEEMHVDGFRFDEAVTLGRQWPGAGFNPGATFFQAVHLDPVLSRVKLIAEPWDVGQGGFQQGNFPVLWSEWNGRYRDAVRRFWRGDENQVAEMGYRLTGSSDLFQGGGRRPHASINYVTTHDGFTLADLVTYANKHNEANGEANRDGPNDNYSWNYGVEGPCEHPAIVRLRERQKRNLMATLLLSQGVPMILAGDEMGRTQGGNNNAYCQDNEISWLDWHLDEHQQAFLRFTSMMIEVRKRHGVLRHDRFFRGDRIWDSRLKDLAWFRPDGSEMSAEDWQRPFGRTLAFLLGGDALTVPDQYGRVASGDTLLVLLNAHHEPVEFVLPKLEWGADWRKIVDTSEELGQPEPVHVAALGRLVVDGRSLVVLCQRVNESKDEEVAAIGASP